MVRRGGAARVVARDTTGKALPPWVCTYCKDGKCNQCTDIMRAVYELDPVCNCKAKGHSGEPRDKQILDPETGTVHAPGMTISQDGEVTRT